MVSTGEAECILRILLNFTQALIICKAFFTATIICSQEIALLGSFAGLTWERQVQVKPGGVTAKLEVCIAVKAEPCIETEGED